MIWMGPLLKISQNECISCPTRLWYDHVVSNFLGNLLWWLFHSDITLFKFDKILLPFFSKSSQVFVNFLHHIIRNIEVIYHGFPYDWNYCYDNQTMTGDSGHGCGVHLEIVNVNNPRVTRLLYLQLYSSVLKAERQAKKGRRKSLRLLQGIIQVCATGR